MNSKVATIGFFDGVHLGHRYLINQVLHEAGLRGMESLLITFDQHPRQVVCPNYIPQLLSTLNEKKRLIQEQGINHTEVLAFTPEMSQMHALDFMKKVLKEKLNVKVLVMGYDHRFGHGGGTHEQYVEWGKESGIEVLLAHELDGEKVSSSCIRQALMEGQMSAANHMLGYMYQLEGIVVQGHRIGRKIGFPTANLQADAEKMLPAQGVYAVKATLSDGIPRNGMLNIGSRPTLQNGTDISIEVNIFDYTGDLYGQKITLQIAEKMRDERAFSSTCDLKAQLQEDAKQAFAILSQLN